MLEHVYTEIRAAEQRLNLDDLEPVAAMRGLINFTFTFFQTHQDYIALINNENLQRGRNLRKCEDRGSYIAPGGKHRKHSARGAGRPGLFRSDVDPIQLYVTITAMSYFHVSNRYTLSAMFDKDLGDPNWLELRREHAQDVILTWLTAPSGKRTEVIRSEGAVSRPRHARTGD